ncbi:MAG: ribosome maturation factor RimP, partial [Shewanella sp.]
MATLESRLVEMLKVPVEALGFQLWGIEYVQAGKHSTLRVFIDGENGINIED